MIKEYCEQCAHRRNKSFSTSMLYYNKEDDVVILMLAENALVKFHPLIFRHKFKKLIINSTSK